MKNYRPFQSLFLAGFFVFALMNSPILSVAQVEYHSGDFSLSITGTSSVHDWEIKSDKGQVEAVFVLDKNKTITGLSGLHFAVETKSLKSGRGSMDNNTYKALKTKSHNSISFDLTSAKIRQLRSESYEVQCRGNLSIAGATRETELVANCKLNADKTFTCSGIKKLKMTDFNVQPPTALMGTIKTGNDISIAYNLNITK